MNVRPVALLAALVPFFAVHATYLVAAGHGHVDWCIPYLDSCTSISATGRKPPASYLFRATMLPTAVIMMAYWWLNFVWLRHLREAGYPAGARAPGPSAIWWMLGLGLLACTGLIMYVTVLGEQGDTWAKQRRTGTVLFYSFTYLSQLLLTDQLWAVRRQLPASVSRWLVAMWLVCMALLAAGLLSVVLGAWNEAWYDTVEDAFEWALTLLLQSNFLLGYFTWRASGWNLRVVDGA
jgi:hypothetical protein